MELKQKTRTNLQNSSLHLYCQQVADLLNESGISMAVFFKNLEADYTMEIIKNLFRKYAKVKYGKKSTTELTTNEVTAIFDEITRHISQFGLFVEWPNKEYAEKM